MRKVLTDGVFDLLHTNHIALLEKARTFGDWLVVGVLSDRRSLECKRLPIIPQDQRMKCVEALSCVDEVFLIDDPLTPETMKTLISDYGITAVVHAGTSTPEFYTAAEEAQIMHHLSYHTGVNTSDIIQRIVEMNQNGEL